MNNLDEMMTAGCKDVTRFITACCSNDSREAEGMLDRGMDVNCRDVTAATGLYHAMRNQVRWSCVYSPPL